MGTVLDGILCSPEIKTEFLKCLRGIVLKALNDTQLLILRKIDKMQRIANANHSGNGGNGGDGYKTLNSLLENISQEHKKALSTLKFNAKVLKELGLIDYGEKYERRPVELTDMGKIFLRVLEGDK